MLKRATIKSEVRNPKSEIRNKFESESGNGKTCSKKSGVFTARSLRPARDANHQQRVVREVLRFSYFHLGISLLFQISDFRISDLTGASYLVLALHGRRRLIHWSFHAHRSRTSSGVRIHSRIRWCCYFSFVLKFIALK